MLRSCSNLRKRSADGESSDIAISEGSTVCSDSFSVEANPFLDPIELLDVPSECCVQETHLISGSSSYRPSPELDLDSISTAWWLLHTKPRQEKRLAGELKSLGIGHYLPATEAKAITRGRHRYSWAPLFPGYLFLWATADERLAALRTNRIVTSYPVGDPKRLSQQLWDLADLIEKKVPLRIEERLAPGRHVRVKSGLLKDKQGVIIKRGGKTRLFVFVSELLGGVSVEVEQHLLEAY